MAQKLCSGLKGSQTFICLLTEIWPPGSWYKRSESVHLRYQYSLTNSMRIPWKTCNSHNVPGSARMTSWKCDDTVTSPLQIYYHVNSRFPRSLCSFRCSKLICGMPWFKKLCTRSIHIIIQSPALAELPWVACCAASPARTLWRGSQGSTSSSMASSVWCSPLWECGQGLLPATSVNDDWSECRSWSLQLQKPWFAQRQSIKAQHDLDWTYDTSQLNPLYGLLLLTELEGTL